MHKCKCKAQKRNKWLSLLNHVTFFNSHLLFSQPVPEELQNGEKFGYVVAFRPLGTTTWKQSVLALADASRYVYKNDTFPPLTQFEVKVGVYNEIGEGPFSPVVNVYSADEGIMLVFCVDCMQIVQGHYWTSFRNDKSWWMHFKI